MTSGSSGGRRGRRVAPTFVGVALVALLALTVAACSGGSSTDSGSTGTGSGTGAATAADGTPIKVLTYADSTVQPPAPSSKFISESVKAAIEGANAEGGINGHPIELAICDSKLDPNAATACGRQAVEEEVVAVVGGESLFDTQISELVEKEGIPMIGPIALTPPTYNGDLTYCHTPQTSTSLELMAQLAREVGVHKLSLIINGGTPIAEDNVAAFEKGVEVAGLELGNVVEPSTQTTNFTAAATQAAAGGGDGVIVLPLSQTASIAEQIKQQEPGLKIILPSFVFSFGGEWPADLDGTAVLGATQPPTAENVPGIKTYKADMEKYAPDTELTETSAYEWLAGNWFARVAREIKGEVTSESLIEAFDNLHEFDMGGITPPYNSADRGKVASEKCAENDSGVRDELKDNQLYAVNPGKFIRVSG